jgi:DUF1680 family protein
MEKLELSPLKHTQLDDPFWNKYTHLVTSQIIPYQWEALNDRVSDAEPSHCISNFKVAAGLKEGTFEGAVFQDTDVAKWLEAVAYSLSYQPDKELEETADEVIDLIGKAQQPDGYINTYFTVLAPKHRWKNLREGHELYTAGHLLEAAVAYYKVTGKDKFLGIMRKFADLICDVFHTEEYKQAVPGHQEIEIAMIKLAEVTGEQKYMDMAKDFIDRRGTAPNYLVSEHKNPLWIDIFKDRNAFWPKYSQCHEPVRKQNTAEGHSVRATYMYSAMADLAAAYDDKELLEACERLWNNIVERRMYITGGIGSSGAYERFTTDYDLPNDSNYCESCASIGLALFGRRMAQVTRNGKYIDTMERALYNTVLAGIAMDGKSFFYVNPLEVWPDNCLDRTSMEHVKPVRQKWFGVACCPPNIARTLASLGEYVYFQKDGDLWVNMFVSGKTSLTSGEGTLTVTQSTRFPFEGKVNLHVTSDRSCESTIAFHVPAYALNYKIEIDSKEVSPELKDGYAYLKDYFKDSDIQITFDIPAHFTYANPNVRADAGKVAIEKGPLVYCLEEEDNGNKLANIYINTAAPLQEQYDSSLFGGTCTISAKGKRISSINEDGQGLYLQAPPAFEETSLKFVPYCYWNNRRAGEMSVWVKYYNQ